MEANKILITGAGTGFGRMIALVLSQMGKEVIATTETMSQASELREDSKKLDLPMQIEKIDITDPADREKAWEWDIDVLVNNASVKEGGALVDIPEENFRYAFEVNVMGTTFLTQGFARQMIEKGEGRIVFMSSISGLMVNPFSGAYSATKFATEAIANTFSQELQEFNIEVQTINPGPHLTGFNDREMEKWRTWKDDPSKRIFDYEEIAFPFEQLDPKEVVVPSIEVILGGSHDYRTMIPKIAAPVVKQAEKHLWRRKANKDLGKRHMLVQRAYDMKPRTKMGSF